MKTYNKRLLSILAGVLVVILVSAVFIQPVFTVGTEELKLSLSGEVSGEDVIGRSRTASVPSAQEIDAQGYDTTLPAGFEVAVEDSSSVLYFRKDTGEVALKDKATGQVWLSNPDDYGSETMVEGTTRQRIGAQLTVFYYDSKGSYGQMDSYNDCIAYGNMAYDTADGCLKVTYRLGKTVVTAADVPQQMTKTRFEKFTGDMDKADRDYLLDQYGLATLEGANDSFKEKLIKKYPNIESDDIYYLKFDSARILTKVKAIWDKAGYTFEDLEADNRENQVKTEEISRAHFAIVLEYRLIDGALQVTVDGSKLEYEEDIPPHEIRLLEYFGAGNGQDKGYMLLADGAGSLIYYNNGKTQETAFSMPVYGANTVADTESQYIVDNKMSLPVYGIKRGSAAMLVTIDRGQSLCSVNARVAGMQNSYNTAYPSFIVTDHEAVTISTDSVQHYNEKDPYRGQYVVTYHPLGEKNADYIDMAQAYRQWLLKDGVLSRKTVSKEYPLMLSYICGVPSTKLVLGFPTDTVKALTTFEQAESMTKSFLEQGTKGLAVRIEGWMNGGLEQQYVGRVQVEKALGGKAGLLSLKQYLEQQGIAFYPDAYVSSVFAKGNGFSPSRDNIRSLSRDIAVRYDYDSMNRYKIDNTRVIYQLLPSHYLSAVTSLLNGTQKLKLGSLALPDLATNVYSDYRKNKEYNREESMEQAVLALKQLSGAQSLAMSNPNAYGLAYSGYVYDLPISDSSYRLCDEAVPFYQAVIRGLVDYVSPSLNYQDDYQQALLSAVEFGSGLQYTLSASTTAMLKDTDYNHINRGLYTDWQPTIVNSYQKAAELLTPLQGVEITGHSRRSVNVYRTDYANGTNVYVNYNDRSVTVDGVRIEGRSFAAVSGGI